MRRTFWLVVVLIAGLVAVGVVSAASSHDDRGKGEGKAVADDRKDADDGKRSKGKHDGKRLDITVAFKAEMSGDQEVVAEGAPTPSKLDTRGHFKLLVSSDRSKAWFVLKIRDGEDIFGTAGAHIHCAPAGVNGLPVVWLAGAIPAGAPALDGSVKVSGMISGRSIIPTDPKAEGATCPAAITDIDSLVEAAKAGYLYANAHSHAFPGGAVRGQLEQADSSCVWVKGKRRHSATFGKRCVIVKSR